VKSLWPIHSLPGLGERGKIDPVEEARPAISAARRDRELDLRVGRHAQDRGDALIVGRREALPSRRARRIDDHAMTELREQVHGAIDCRRIRHEARRRVEADAEGALRHGISTRAAR
jgi:hypothetical protein